MPLDHPFTCPIIDKQISQFKGELECFVENLLEELNPLYASEQKLKDVFVATKCKEFYDTVESVFETIRESNSDLRSSADVQIDNLERIIDSYDV